MKIEKILPANVMFFDDFKWTPLLVLIVVLSSQKNQTGLVLEHHWGQ